ncbi:ATP-binding protein [Thalassiella azotivora]
MPRTRRRSPGGVAKHDATPDGPAAPPAAGEAAVLHRLEEALGAARDLDEVARAALTAALSLPGATRAGLAALVEGGRLVRFTVAGAAGPRRPVRWCELDGLADVPVVRSCLTGRPVLLPDRDAIERRYPHLLGRRTAPDAGALAAVPMDPGGVVVGALLVGWAHARDLDADLPVLRRVARAVGDALGRRDHAPDDARPPAGDLRPHRAVDAREPRLEHAFHLAARVSAPRAARRIAHAQMSRWGVDAATQEDVALCLSEVVTNAVIHAASATDVTLTLATDRVRVEVTDEGLSARPRHREPAARTSTRAGGRHVAGGRADGTGSPRAALHRQGGLAVGGRGFLLLEHLAARVTQDDGPRGTTVAFEVLRPPGQPAAGASTVSAPGTTSHTTGSGPTDSPSA